MPKVPLGFRILITIGICIGFGVFFYSAELPTIVTYLGGIAVGLFCAVPWCAGNVERPSRQSNEDKTIEE